MTLIKCYEEALRLTEAQGQAIADDHWDEFETLLQKREKALLEAGKTLLDATQAEKTQAIPILQEIRRIDALNEKAFQIKKAHVQAMLREMSQSQQARDQYLDAYDAPEDAKFFDRGM